MMIDIAGVDGGKVCDKQAGMEGAEVDDRLGEQAVLIQKTKRTEKKFLCPFPVRLNFGYMHSFFEDHKVEAKNSVYTRKNDAVGVSLDITF